MPDELIRPMLATLSDALPPEDGRWGYEMKWDGVRAILYVGSRRTKIMSRNDIDMLVSYPELAALTLPGGTASAVLDGEIVALDHSGRPSFEQLQGRMHVGDAKRAQRLADANPVTYLVFDVLRLDRRSLLSTPYTERRSILEGLELDGPAWRTPGFWTEDGASILEAARDQRLEGVLCKLLDSHYYPGRRFPGWLKVKNLRTQEVVVGGWQPGEGRRSGGIGALLLGIPTDGGLEYVGKVGTGFTERSLRELGARLEPLRRSDTPFATAIPRKDSLGATWVRAEVVGEVRFSEWTRDGRLRHPAWRGLRDDKSVAEVVRES
ncbi:MAG: non-homologous end-joining DNA ligase [Actinomycetales bacterium]